MQAVGSIDDFITAAFHIRRAAPEGAAVFHAGDDACAAGRPLEQRRVKVQAAVRVARGLGDEAVVAALRWVAEASRQRIEVAFLVAQRAVM
ncbi:hypothetical protein D3C85_1762060 [compost metagenome]